MNMISNQAQRDLGEILYSLDVRQRGPIKTPMLLAYDGDTLVVRIETNGGKTHMLAEGYEDLEARLRDVDDLDVIDSR